MSNYRSLDIVGLLDRQPLPWGIAEDPAPRAAIDAHGRTLPMACCDYLDLAVGLANALCAEREKAGAQAFRGKSHDQLADAVRDQGRSITRAHHLIADLSASAVNVGRVEDIEGRLQSVEERLIRIANAAGS